MCRATLAAALVLVLAPMLLASIGMAGETAADELIERLPVENTGTLHVVLQRGDVILTGSDEPWLRFIHLGRR